MKKILVLITLLYSLTGCNNQKTTHLETATKYYHALDNADFSQIEPLINDSLTIIAGDYIAPYTKESFYEFFRWDSTFHTTHKLTKIENQNEHVISTVSSSSVRYKFLKNDPLCYSYKISFINGKISMLEDLGCPDTDWNIWQQQRDTLTSWIKINHPRLDGFINDLSTKGALEYLEAIELYEGRIEL